MRTILVVMSGLLALGLTTAHAESYFPTPCVTATHSPPEAYRCPTPYVELVPDGSDGIFDRNYLCRETGLRLGAFDGGGCGSSAGISGWTVPEEPSPTEPVPIETVAVHPRVVLDSVIEELSEAERRHLLGSLASMVRIMGWRCDEISSARRLMLSKGFKISCNRFDYTYLIQDRGGNWTVSLK